MTETIIITIIISVAVVIIAAVVSYTVLLVKEEVWTKDDNIRHTYGLEWRVAGLEHEVGRLKKKGTKQ